MDAPPREVGWARGRRPRRGGGTRGRPWRPERRGRGAQGGFAGVGGMREPVRRLTFSEEDTHDAELMLGREWLVTNGLGGFASGTLAGVPTRRYHGLLIAALPTPLGRTVMFNHLSEWLRLPEGERHQIGGQERSGGQLEWPGAKHLREFRLEAGL